MKLLYLEPNELTALLKSAAKNSLHDYAALYLTYQAALRVSECGNLLRSDLKAPRNMVMVSVLKRTKRKTPGEAKKEAPREAVFVGPKITELLLSHIKSSPESEWLFPYPRDPRRQMSRFNLLDMFARYATKIGLDAARRRHIHILRHTRAIDQLRLVARISEQQGKTFSLTEQMKDLQKLLRHASSDVCMEYIHVSQGLAAVSELASQTIADELFEATHGRT